MRQNVILDTDSYKTSHYLQYPPGMTAMYSYLESRGGEFERTVFFGLQYLIKEYLKKPVTTEDIQEAEAFCLAHGVPFPRKGWERVRDLGYFPIRIKAVREGMVIPVKNVLMTVESTDPESFWIVGWLETILMRMWYPITVATMSWYCKKTIFRHLKRTADDALAEIDFKLHDFGSRGVSSSESALIGGMAHLVNFKGSDTIVGIRGANHYYGTPEGMAAFSIPAAEHSTITSWGREHEIDAYRNMLTQFAKPGAIVACVSDSYDLFAAIDMWTGPLLQQVKDSGATLVVRPDSGDPAAIVYQVLRHFDANLQLEKNSKGFKVLPKYFRIIQGDGVNITSINEILMAITEAGYSASNVAFGMGGALLQKVDRDTQKFAFKCSAAKIDGKWHDVFKDPITDPGKVSKKGRLDLIRALRSSSPSNLDYITVPEPQNPAGESELHLVFENGKQMGSEIMLDVVRANAMEAIRAGY